jgi:hypothetical protein
MVQFGKINLAILIIKMQFQINLFRKLPSYYSSMYGKDEGEYSGFYAG